MIQRNFFVGQEVIVASPDLPASAVGRIVALTNEPGKTVGVEFYDEVGIHSCDGAGRHGYCLWATPEHVRLPSELPAAGGDQTDEVSLYQRFRRMQVVGGSVAGMFD